MRKLIACIGGLATVVLALSSCRTDYPIKAVGEPFAPTFEIGEELACGAGSAHVSEFDPETRNEKEVWSIDRERPGTLFIANFKYGEIPKGFVVRTTPLPLRPGPVYIVHARCGGASGTGFFKIEQDGAGFRLINTGGL